MISASSTRLQALTRSKWSPLGKRIGSRQGNGYGSFGRVVFEAGEGREGGRRELSSSSPSSSEAGPSKPRLADSTTPSPPDPKLAFKWLEQPSSPPASPPATTSSSSHPWTSSPSYPDHSSAPFPSRSQPSPSFSSPPPPPPTRTRPPPEQKLSSLPDSIPRTLETLTPSRWKFILPGERDVPRPSASWSFRVPPQSGVEILLRPHSMEVTAPSFGIPPSTDYPFSWLKDSDPALIVPNERKLLSPPVHPNRAPTVSIIRGLQPLIRINWKGEFLEEEAVYSMKWLAQMARRRQAEGSGGPSSSSSTEEDSGRIAWLDKSKPSSLSSLPIPPPRIPPLDYSSTSSSNTRPFRSIASVSASELIKSPSPLGREPLVIRGAANDQHNSERIQAPKDLDEVVDALGAELNLQAGFRRRTLLTPNGAPGGLDFSMDFCHIRYPHQYEIIHNDDRNSSATLHVIDGFELARNLHEAAPVAFNALALNPIPIGSVGSLTFRLPRRTEHFLRPTITLSPASARLLQLRRTVPLYRDSPPSPTPEITSINFAPSFQHTLKLNKDVDKTLQGLRWMMLEAAQAIDVQELQMGIPEERWTDWGIERTRKVTVVLKPGDALIFRRDRFLVSEEPMRGERNWGLARWFCNLKKPFEGQNQVEERLQDE